MDCFAEFIIGRRSAPTRWLAMTMETDAMAKAAKAVGIAQGQCLCGSVRFEIDVPARWAWHDHSAASRRAHGAAYATYVGSWRKRFRIVRGKAAIARYEDEATKTVRSFCAQCGTPLIYERARSPHMVNIPRALFSGRTAPKRRSASSVTGCFERPARSGPQMQGSHERASLILSSAIGHDGKTRQVNGRGKGGFS
jgi:hypothetical protein